MRRNQQRLEVLCRPGRHSDTPDVLELTKDIWGGDDYLPEVWAEWLADPQGLLVVAEHQGSVLGLGKLTRLSQEDWWLEGLRVHPAYQGRGIASQLNDFLLAHWEHSGSGTVRLGTGEKRYPVHHMCERSGFDKVCELAKFRAPASHDHDAAILGSKFRPLTKAETTQAVAFIINSQTYQLSGCLVDIGWQWAPARSAYLAESINQGKAWWWVEQKGLLAVVEWDEEEKIRSRISVLACPLAEIGGLLRDARRLTGARGYQQITWKTQPYAELLQGLEAAGFETQEDDCILLFAKRHPIP